MTEEERKIRARDATRRYRSRNPGKHRVKEAEYRRKHIVRIRARDARIKREYRRLFPEKHKADRSVYKSANLTKIRASEKSYKKRNQAKARIQMRIYRAANPGRVKAWDRRRRAKNADDIRVRNGEYRARKRGATIGDKHVIKDWESRWRRSKIVRCFWCSIWLSPKGCHTDHIESLAAGGKHSIENLCIACGPCNLRKNAKSIQEWNSVIPEPVLL